MSMQFAQGYGTTSVGADFGGSQANAEPLNLGPNIFPAQPGQLPPEAFHSQTPTVRTLPPKVVTTRLQPIFPPGSAPSAMPQF